MFLANFIRLMLSGKYHFKVQKMPSFVLERPSRIKWKLRYVFHHHHHQDSCLIRPMTPPFSPSTWMPAHHLLIPRVSFNTLYHIPFHLWFTMILGNGVRFFRCMESDWRQMKGCSEIVISWIISDSGRSLTTFPGFLQFVSSYPKSTITSHQIVTSSDMLFHRPKIMTLSPRPPPLPAPFYSYIPSFPLSLLGDFVNVKRTPLLLLPLAKSKSKKQNRKKKKTKSEREATHTHTHLSSSSHTHTFVAREWLIDLIGWFHCTICSQCV